MNGATNSDDKGSLKTEQILMTYDDLAKALSISLSHTKRIVKTHNVPRVKLGKLVRFEREAIVKWLKKYQRSHNVS